MSSVRTSRIVIEENMSLPGTENILLLQIVSLLILLVHLGFAAFLVGGSSVAILLQVNGIRGRHAGRRRVSAALLNLAIPKSSILVLLPILGGLNLLVLDALYSPAFERTLLRAAMAALLLAGVGLLFLLRHRLLERGSAGLPAAATGLIGIVFLLCAYFLFFCELALLLRPEKWPILTSLPLLVLSWSAFGKFLQFLCVGLALGGSGLLFVARGPGIADEEMRSARRLGTVVATASLLLLPVGLFFDLFNMPSLGFSPSFFSVQAVALLIAAAVAWRLASCWEFPDGSGPGLVLGGLLVLLPLLLGADHLARENVLIAQTLQRPEGSEPPSRREAPAAMKKTEEAEEKEETLSGEAIFERVCAGCHAFDRRVVGPPLNEVLPKYDGDREALEAFIRDPVKIDPDYPAMPDPGLPPEEIEAVAGYLLEQGGG